MQRHIKMLIFFAGGVLCPPFSIAGKKLGKDDERDQFPEALRLISESTPKNCNVRKCKRLSRSYL